MSSNSRILAIIARRDAPDRRKQDQKCSSVGNAVRAGTRPRISPSRALQGPDRFRQRSVA